MLGLEQCEDQVGGIQVTIRRIYLCLWHREMLSGSTGQDVFEVESKGLVINCYLLGPGNMDSSR